MKQPNLNDQMQPRTKADKDTAGRIIVLFKVKGFNASLFQSRDPQKSRLIPMGFTYTASARRADICIASSIEDLKPLIRRFRTTKRYLVWTTEPRAETCFSSIANYRGARIHIMNAYTGDVWTDNYCALKITHWKTHFRTRNPLDGQKGFSRPGGKKIVALLAYRNDPEQWRLLRNGQNIDLSYMRTQIAYQGYQQRKADVFGRGWPHSIALEDSRLASDWAARKLEILQRYSFNLCMENTNVDYYCTEKIWHSIQAGCLPIYYGRGNRIYQDFPRNSFLDYAEFSTPSDLFHYIDQMTFDEFQHRYSLCLDTCNRIVDASDSYRYGKRARIDAAVDRMRSLVNEPAADSTPRLAGFRIGTGLKNLINYLRR